MLRSNLTVATGTAMSRVTGVARVAVLGAVLGTPSAVADAYDLANSTPNMVYELLMGGILSSSLVPLFTRLREEGDDEGADAVTTVSLLVVGAITLVAVAFAPLVFRLYSVLTAESVDAAQYRQVGSVLARIFLVQIFFYGLNTLASVALNARRRFFAAAWTPALSNLVIIASLLLVPLVVDRPPTLDDVLSNGRLRWLLGGGATLGIAMMALALVPALRAAGVRYRFRPDFRNPAVRTLRAMSGWALGYVVANQVALVVVRNLLRGGDGSAFAYSRAYLWFVLPHGLLAVSIATTFLPEMSSAATRRDQAALVEHTSLGIRLITLVTLPAAFGLFVLRRPIIGAAFQHGNVSAADALVTSRVLGGFALGLAAFSVYLFAIRVFYAQLDARTPFLLNLMENVVNIVLAVVLVRSHGLLGLSVSFAIAYGVAAIVTLIVVARRTEGFHLAPLAVNLGRMLVAAGVMALAVWPVARAVGSNVGAGAVLRVVAGTLTGVVVYLAALVALRTPEVAQLRRRLLRR
ncbi:MAG: murein biosynthesis integral membrane protein MurJ [Actinomycetota bacterium]